MDRRKQAGSAAGQGLLPLPGFEDSARIQVEEWSRGDVHRLLLVAQGQGGAVGYLMAKDDRTGAIATGASHVEPCPSHHDRDALASAIVTDHATALDMVAMNAFARISPLADRLIDVMKAEAPTAEGASRMDFPGSPALKCAEAYLEELGRHRVSRRFDDEATARVFGYHVASALRLAVVDGDTVSSAPGTGPTPPSVTAFPGPPGKPNIHRLTVEDEVMGALMSFTGRHGGPVTRMLGAKGWSTEAYGYFALPGPLGERRMQAAALYPALAPVIARSRTVRDLVDAGRPFERALRDELARTLPPELREGFGVGALRRMRGLPSSTKFTEICRATHMATRLPLDWLPTDARGWEAFRERTRGVEDKLRDLGLDWSDYARSSGPDWTAFGVPEEGGKRPETSMSTVGSLHGAKDMARHLARTLLRPLNRALGFGDDDDAWRGEIDEASQAGRLLFGGRGQQAVHDLQVGWHADMHTLEANLPVPEGDNVWPALFDRFEAGGGIHVVCLTAESELKAEGGKAPDADGVPGLNHCVGSYAEQCYEGTIFVASVRRVDTGGRVTRLSTVEFSLDSDGDELLVLVEEQHMGRGNDDPPEEAVAAVEALQEAVRAGHVPLNAEAFAERTSEGFKEGYDWREPGAAARAFEAWRRHLPRDIARGGLEALVRRIAADAGVDPEPALEVLLVEPDAGPRP